jgi:hypothetical protein
MKEALYGTDVRTLLRNIGLRAAALSDDEFHQAMRTAIRQLRDHHTHYSLRSGDRHKLPFFIERAFRGDAPAYFGTAFQSRKP